MGGGKKQNFSEIELQFFFLTKKPIIASICAKQKTSHEIINKPKESERGQKSFFVSYGNKKNGKRREDAQTCRQKHVLLEAKM